MPENMKRKITVESSSTKKDSQPRPSVFDRLGKKSATSSTATTVVTNNESSGICRHWAAAGTCPYGKNCKYAVTHTLISPSKQRAAKKDIVDTKLKTNSNSTHTASALKSSIPSKEDLNKRIHSAVIRKGRTGTGGSPDLNWENWDQTDLEYEDEKVLEKRRQLLQRELELQMTKEKDHEKKKKVKKVKKGASSCSSTSASSSSSTESTSSSDDSSSTSSSTSVDSRKKKAKKTTKQDSSSSTSGTDHATSKKKSSKSAKSGSLPSSKKMPPAHKDDHRSGSSKIQESSASKKPVSGPANQTQPSTKKRSTTPLQDRSKRRSQTPPHLNENSKEKTSGAAKKSTSASSSKHNLSPVAKRPSSGDRKSKRSVSPHPSGRDREKAKSKDRDKEREKEKERDKERDTGRVAGRNGTPPKGKAKDRVASPKRSPRGPREPRKRDSPDGAKDKRRQSPAKSRRSSSRGRTREDGADKRALSRTAGSRDADRRNDSRDPSRGAVKNSDRDTKKNDDGGKVTKSNKDMTKSTSSSGRSRDDPSASRRSENSVVTSRETGRKLLPNSTTKSGSDRDLNSKGDKDRNKDQRDNSRDNRGVRDSARDGRGANKDVADPRLPRNSKNVREMREAEREKEREEALERCRERQRERERKAQERDRKVQERDRKVHELEEKAREHERELPSLLMIATHNPIKSVRNGGREDSKGRDKGSERGSDRSHEKDRTSDRDRDLEKAIDRERTTDRGSDRDRGPPSRAAERDRDRERALDRSANDKDRDRAADRSADRNHERDRDRGFDRSLDHERPLDRDRDRGQERDRPTDRGPLDRDRTFDRSLERAQNKSPHRGMNRGPSDRNYDRGADHGFERESDRCGFERDGRDSEREYAPLGRGRDDVRRPPLAPDDKGSGYDSPYDGRRGREERGRYADQLERTRYDDSLAPREDSRRAGADLRSYPDDRRGRRDPRESLEPVWEGRNRDSPESRRRPGYGDEPRSPPLPVKGRPGWEPPPVKGRPDWEPPPAKGRPDWEQRDYGDGRREWDGRGGGRRGPPLDWDNQRRGDWLEKDSVHPPLEEEWDMYTGPNAPPDWPVGGDRWPVDEWERPPRGTPNRTNRGPAHRDGSAPPPRDIKLEEPVKVEDIKKELPEVFQPADPVAVKEEDVGPIKTEDQDVAPTLKRPLDTSDSEVDKPEAKKVCLEESVPLEEDLSDISDDDADEILNREDIELASQAVAVNEDKLAQAPPAVVMNGCIDSIKMDIDPDKEAEKFDKSADLMTHDLNRDATDQSALQDDETIDNLDFEEISDEELEEESKVGLADALGVDWASLVAECRPRDRSEVAPGSARRHWEGHRMLARIGVSLRYAGQELVDRITDKFNEINKERDKDDKAVEEEELEFLHPVAAIHVVLREKRKRREELLASAGPYKRALSARRDLLIRRQLCNLPVSEITVESGSQNTDDIYRLAIQLFERDD